MESFSIKWKSSAKKELKKIDRTEISKILSEIEKLSIVISVPFYTIKSP